MATNGCGFLFWDNGKVLELDAEMVTQLCKYSENLPIVDCQRMNFMVWELYLNNEIILKI